MTTGQLHAAYFSFFRRLCSDYFLTLLYYYVKSETYTGDRMLRDNSSKLVDV